MACNTTVLNTFAISSQNKSKIKVINCYYNNLLLLFLYLFTDKTVMSKKYLPIAANTISQRIDWTDMKNQLILDIASLKRKYPIRPMLSEISGLHKTRVAQIASGQITPSFDDFIRLQYSLNEIRKIKTWQGYISSDNFDKLLGIWTRCYMSDPEQKRINIRKRKTKNER